MAYPTLIYQREVVSCRPRRFFSEAEKSDFFQTETNRGGDRSCCLSENGRILDCAHFSERTPPCFLEVEHVTF